MTYSPLSKITYVIVHIIGIHIYNDQGNSKHVIVLKFELTKNSYYVHKLNTRSKYDQYIRPKYLANLHVTLLKLYKDI